MDAQYDFAGKLSLALKVANLSRGGLASAAGVDKSLVGRWARGLVKPTDHNLSLVTDALRARLPGFSRLTWELDGDDFAAAIGAPAPPGARPANGEADEPAGGIALPQSLARSEIEVRREGSAYPGTYVGFRLAFRNNGDLTSELVTIRRDGDRLFFRQRGAVFNHLGEALLLRNQLHFIGEEDDRVNGIYFVVLNGVSGQRALRLDGVFATVHGDKLHSPSATPIVYARLTGPGGSDGPDDEQSILAVHARLKAIQDAGGLPELAGPDILNAIRPTIGGEGDCVMRVPAHASLAASELDATPDVHAHLERMRRALMAG